jgi:hypothetical protein
MRARIRSDGRRPGGSLARSFAVGMTFLVLSLATSGCTPFGSRGAGPNPFDPEGGLQGEVILRVENLLQEQVTIRVAAGGPSRELGAVPGRSSQQFSVEVTAARISFQLEPFSGRRHTMPSVSVQPGDVLDLRVVNPIERSSLRR